MKKKTVIVLSFFLIVFCFQCKKDSTTNLIAQVEAEGIAGIAARTVTSLIGSVYQTSIRLSDGNKHTVKNLSKGIDFNANYNNSTGWWSLSFNHDGYQVSINVQLQDESGNYHKNFSSNTNKILVQGDGSGPDLLFTIDWTISGLSETSNVFLIDGSGTIEYKGESASLSLSGAEIQKVGNVNPTDGTLTINVGGVTFILNYDGTSIITVTYSYDGESYTIIVNIQTGEVTRIS